VAANHPNPAMTCLLSMSMATWSAIEEQLVSAPQKPAVSHGPDRRATA